MATRLVFTPRYHSYSLDGHKVPGVTTVINRALAKPGLVYAAAREAARWAADNHEAFNVNVPGPWVEAATKAHRVEWDKAAKRGTFLHEAARQLIGGEPLAPVDDDGTPWPEDVVAAAHNLARFMDEWDVEPLLSERPVFNDVHHWAGTIDLVADLGDGKRWLLDYKTGASGIYPEHALQLAAYRHATHVQQLGDDEDMSLVDHAMPEVDDAACIWVRPDGYEVVPVRADDSWYRVFLAMLPVYRWAALGPEASVGDPLPVPAGVA